MINLKNVYIFEICKSGKCDMTFQIQWDGVRSHKVIQNNSSTLITWDLFQSLWLLFLADGKIPYTECGPKKLITTINFFLHQKPISNLKIGFGFLWTLGILIFDVKSFSINFLAFCTVASNYLNVDINIVYAKIRNIISKTLSSLENGSKHSTSGQVLTTSFSLFSSPLIGRMHVAVGFFVTLSYM